MSELEMKKLSRRELLDVLADREDEIDRLRLKLVELERKASDREVKISRAGSIAEAALSLNSVFESAEKAAAQYLENIQRLSGEQESVCQEMLEKARAEADHLVADAKKRADTLLEESRKKSEIMLGGARQLEGETRQKCEDLKAKAQAEADQYWNTVYRRLRQFCQSREELKRLLMEGCMPLTELPDGGETGQTETEK